MKLELHKYICDRCGMGKTNVLVRGNWSPVWSTPDGDDVAMVLTPPCAPGLKTAERLAWLSTWRARQAEATS